MGRERRIQLAGAGVLFALAGVTLPRVEVVLDLAGFMLGEDGTALAELSRQVARSEASRTLVVLLEGPSTEAAIEGARALEERLRADPVVRERVVAIDGGPPAGLDDAVWSLYRPRLLAFAASSTEAAARLTSDAGLAASLDELSTRLRTPASALLSRVAPEDPLLVLPRLFERLARAGQGGLRIEDGRFVSRSGHAVLFVRTRASAFRGGEQAPLLDAIEAAAPAGLRLSLGGIHRFAVQIQQSIEADIRRVSVLSVLALLALVLGLFRSLRVAALVGLVVSSGLVVGLFVTVLAFGRIHGLTLAFGASLIGVSVDYAVHFFVHHTVEGAERDPRRLLGELAPGLILGAATTVVGFVALATSSLPGLLEVAVFAGAGIVGALAATFAFLPGAVADAPHRATPTAIARRLARALARLRAAPRSALAVLPAVLLGLGLLGLPRVVWNDDVAELTRIDPELAAEEDRVRAEVSPYEQRRFVVATGPTVEAALEVNDRVAAALRSAEEAGELARWRGLSALLPSPQRQRAVAETVRSAPALAPRLRAAAAARGFRRDAFEPFVLGLADEAAPPLTWAELVESPLGGWLRGFRVALEDGRVGFLTFLGGVEHPEAIRARVERIDGARWLDQGAIFEAASRTHRERTVVGLGLGLGVVVLLVAARYRSLGSTATALVPATLAVLFTVSVLAALGIALDLVGLTALLMVFSMGGDYGVFLAEAERAGPGRAATTLLAVGVAWLSTLAGFGLLALSSHPAMRTIGVVASVGLTSAVLVSPTALLLGRRSAP